MNIERAKKYYLQAEDIEALARQNVELMAELWIVKDRLAMLEAALEKQSLVDRKKLNDSLPTDELEKELTREREAYISRIMGIDPADRTAEALKSRAVTK